MQIDLGPDCLATVRPWGAEGVFLTVRAVVPWAGVRDLSVVREAGLSSGAWRRADDWDWGDRDCGPPGGRPVRPYGPRLHLAAALRWLLSGLWPGGFPSSYLSRLGAVLRREGLRDALSVMES